MKGLALVVALPLTPFRPPKSAACRLEHTFVARQVLACTFAWKARHEVDDSYGLVSPHPRDFLFAHFRCPLLKEKI